MPVPSSINLSLLLLSYLLLSLTERGILLCLVLPFSSHLRIDAAASATGWHGSMRCLLRTFAFALQDFKQVLVLYMALEAVSNLFHLFSLSFQFFIVFSLTLSFEALVLSSLTILESQTSRIFNSIALPSSWEGQL